MKTIAPPLSRPQAASAANLASRLLAFIALMKPRVMVLAVFTALVGLTARRVRSICCTLQGGSRDCRGRGRSRYSQYVVRRRYRRIMTRTMMRPIPRGKFLEGRLFCSALPCRRAVLLLALATNVVAASLLAGTIFFYVVVYTVWLKRSTCHNIVIGGAAGALPPVIGWTAATGDVGAEPLICSSLSFFGHRRTSGRSHSIARTNIRKRVCRCSRLFPGGGHETPDCDLQRSPGANFDASVGDWFCGRALRRGCGDLRSNISCARMAARQERRSRPTRGSPLVHLLHNLSVRAVCGAPR